MFLPKDYQAPKSSGHYMKLQDGENKIRILSAPILGWEDWIEKKPIRYRFDKKPMKAIDPKKPVKHFWAMIVWNYSEEQIQVLQLSQATIRSNIEALCKDSDWGAPYFYDIKIIKKGEGTDTEYMVNPLPHKQLQPKIKEEFMQRRCYLEALFDNADPFDSNWNEFTAGVFSEEDIKKEEKPETITLDQARQLQETFAECDSDYIDQVYLKLSKAPFNITSIEDLPVHLFDRVYDGAVKNKQNYQSQLKALA